MHLLRYYINAHALRSSCMFREAQNKKYRRKKSLGSIVIDQMSVFSSIKTSTNKNRCDVISIGCDSTGIKCGRWSPTSEQVKVLTDLFRSGLQTPSTDQIQKISSQLSSFGKIESKNVFYWFQNHKARERHKRRRVTIVDHDNDDDENDHHVNRTDKIVASIKSFGDITKVLEAETVIETLQLFPLNTFDELKGEKLSLIGHDEYNKESRRFSYSFHANMDYPSLDLRLSFL